MEIIIFFQYTYIYVIAPILIVVLILLLIGHIYFNMMKGRRE